MPRQLKGCQKDAKGAKGAKGCQKNKESDLDLLWCTKTGGQYPERQGGGFQLWAPRDLLLYIERARANKKRGIERVSV